MLGSALQAVRALPAVHLLYAESLQGGGDALTEAGGGGAVVWGDRTLHGGGGRAEEVAGLQARRVRPAQPPAQRASGVGARTRQPGLLQAGPAGLEGAHQLSSLV